MNQKLKAKNHRILISVLPVTCIVLILGITITPIPLDPLDAVSGRGRLPYYRNGILHPGSG